MCRHWQETSKANPTRASRASHASATVGMPDDVMGICFLDRVYLEQWAFGFWDTGLSDKWAIQKKGMARQIGDHRIVQYSYRLGWQHSQCLE